MKEDRICRGCFEGIDHILVSLQVYSFIWYARNCRLVCGRPRFDMCETESFLTHTARWTQETFRKFRRFLLLRWKEHLSFAQQNERKHSQSIPRPFFFVMKTFWLFGVLSELPNCFQVPEVFSNILRSNNMQLASFSESSSKDVSCHSMAQFSEISSRFYGYSHL